MDRTATCQCGSLRVQVTGEPDAVIACSCLACQRRTGSVLHVSATFPEGAVVAIDGPETVYQRPSEAEGTISFHLCPTCGTTVYWPEGDAGATGIAVGCFADSTFPPPTTSFWSVTEHPWLGLPTTITRHAAG